MQFLPYETEYMTYLGILPIGRMLHERQFVLYACNACITHFKKFTNAVTWLSNRSVMKLILYHYFFAKETEVLECFGSVLGSMI